MKKNLSNAVSFGTSLFLTFFFSVFSYSSINAVTYFAREAGPLVWSNTASWSTTSSTGASCGCIPTAADNVVFENNGIGGGLTFTVDGNYSITNVTIGSNSANDKQDITLAVSSVNILTITGDLKINVGNAGKNYALDAAAGTINVNGTFSQWGTGGTDNIKVSTGTITFAPLITMSNNTQNIIFSGIGTINFNSGFTCNQNNGSFVTVAGCTVNFLGTYTQTAQKLTWAVGSNAVFNCVGCTINNSSQVDLPNVTMFNNSNVSTAGAGNLNITGFLTLNTNATFSTNKDLPGSKVSVARSIDNITLSAGSTFNLLAPGTFIQSDGNWFNNGGTLNGGAYTVQFEGIGNTIGGTSATTFPDLKFGNTLNNVNYILSQNISCANLIFDADNSSRELSHDATNPSLTVTGNVTLNQPTAGGKTNLWDIASGSATVAGNLVFAGTNNTTSQIAEVIVSSGSLVLNGNVTWMANNVEATEVIALNTGTITFANSLSMPQRSGTLDVTGAETINFNGAATSYDLNQANGGAPNAVFSTSFGSIINFKAGFRNANTPVTLADGSTAVFTGNGTITPTSAITFGNVQINAGVVTTLAGNISLTTNWTNLAGTFTPATFDVTFSGAATQTITKAAGETFYSLTSNTTGPLTLGSNVMVTNTLNMSAGNYNLNAFTLTLGNSATATLTRTAGIMYLGNFKRWLPVAAISSTSAPLHGLFPVGTSTDYRPIEINSTVNPTTAGYISASHIDALTTTDLSPTTADGAATISRISNASSVLSTAASTLAGGTYNIYVSMTTLGSTGAIGDIRLAVFTGGTTAGVVGTYSLASGSVSAPTAKRTGLSAANLNNDFRISTSNVGATPLRRFYYSIASGTWANTTTVWSLSNGGPACGCAPASDGYAFITALGTPVSVNAPATVDLVDVNTGATLNGTGNFTVNLDLSVYGTGVIAPTTGTWLISRNATLSGTGSSNTSSSVMTVTGNLNVGSGTTLNLGAALTVASNLVVDGTIAAAANTFTLSGTSKNISGLGTISGSATMSSNTGAKTILAGTNLTVGPNFAINGSHTITNNGTISLQRNLTGTAAGSTWTNNPNSVLNITGALLATGTLNSSSSPNTVNYNGGAAQTIKTPASSYYNLTCSNANTKTVAANIIVDNMLTIQNSVTFADGGFSVTGAGGVTMSGTAIYQITDNTNPVP